MVQELFDIWNNLAISAAKFASSMSWKKNNIIKKFSEVKNNFLVPQQIIKYFDHW
jgi:hypothetical protein